MAWKVEISVHAAKQISDLDSPVQKRIYTFLQRLETEADPFNLLTPYAAGMFGLWKKRLGDWRLVIEANHGNLTLIVMKIGHRSKIYR